jgi:Ion channel
MLKGYTVPLSPRGARRAQGHGTFPQALFFPFTTLTTTGYGTSSRPPN